MILKPKSTVRNPKALVYRRFTQLQDSYSTNTIYKTEDDKFWAFDGKNLTFLEVETFNGQVVEVENRGTILEFQGHQFVYTGEWENAITNNGTIVQLEEQPTFYEPQSNTYWAIVQASNGDVSVRQLGTPTQNVITIQKFPEFYSVGSKTGVIFDDTLELVDMIQIYDTRFYKTNSDNKYWKYVDGLMVETTYDGTSLLYPIKDYDIGYYPTLIQNYRTREANTMYYDGTQWNYSTKTATNYHGEYYLSSILIIDNTKYYATYGEDEYGRYVTAIWFYDSTKQFGNQMIKLNDINDAITAQWYHLLDIWIEENYIYVGEKHTYKLENNVFNEVDGIILPNSEFLSAKFGNIARYQTNKYYFVGSFDYMIRGSIEGTTTQHIKGNIMPLTSLNIKYFNDDIELNVDDLVVIEDHLFSVENPETTQKRMPKAFKVHFATLNSIL